MYLNETQREIIAELRGIPDWQVPSRTDLSSGELDALQEFLEDVGMDAGLTGDVLDMLLRDEEAEALW